MNYVCRISIRLYGRSLLSGVCAQIRRIEMQMTHQFSDDEGIDILGKSTNYGTNQSDSRTKYEEPIFQYVSV
jgi:hypothetical protein